MTTNRYFTFLAGGLLFGVDVDRVAEVGSGLDITPVPWAQESIVGVLNLRGQIVTAIDTARRLGLHHRQLDASPRTVILTVGSDLVSFLIDQEGEVIELDEQERCDVPDTVDATLTSFIRGTYQTDNGLLLILDADKVFALEEIGRGTRVTT